MNDARKTKRLGQHFLADAQVIDDIIALIAPQPNDVVVEIGAGAGALTFPLAEKVKHLHALEIDPSLAASLRRTLQSSSVTLHHIDALKFNYRSVGSAQRKIRIVGNLPYSISTPLLIALLDIAECVHDLCLMVQKEVADRLVAQCGASQYSRLTVAVTAVMHVEAVFDVPPDAFNPPPQVESTVICMRPKRACFWNSALAGVFSELVQAAFSKRRKTIRNSLADKISADELRHCGLDDRQRAQNLSVDNYIQLAQYVVHRDTSAQ